MSYLLAHIDLAAIRHNLGIVRSRVGNRKILAIVKADAYGHGAVPVARALLSAGADGLGVAHLEEALELRHAGITSPIFLLFGVESSAAPEVFEHNLTPVIWSLDQGEFLSAEAVRRGQSLSVHVKVDTGMGRVGVRPDRAAEEVKRIHALEGVSVVGMTSHFSDAELEDPNVVSEQVSAFVKIADEVKKAGLNLAAGHMANSAAVIRFPDVHFDMVRPGLMLYGYNPVSDRVAADLRPAMRVTTKVIALKTVPPGTPISYGRTFRTQRESRIATISVGYADGYSRTLSNSGRMIIRGREVPVVGRVCMDLTMVDVTDGDPVQVGDEAILIGESGEHRLWADRLAALAGTIPYEILTSVGKRVKRVYHGE